MPGVGVAVAVVFDVDGVIVPEYRDDESHRSQPCRAAKELIKELSKMAGVALYVNTARPACPHCTDARRYGTLYGIPGENHLCMIQGSATVPASKVKNLDTIRSRCKVLHSHVVFLDNEGANVRAASKAGYPAIHVKEIACKPDGTCTELSENDAIKVRDIVRSLLRSIRTPHPSLAAVAAGATVIATACAAVFAGVRR